MSLEAKIDSSDQTMLFLKRIFGSSKLTSGSADPPRDCPKPPLEDEASGRRVQGSCPDSGRGSGDLVLSPLPILVDQYPDVPHEVGLPRRSVRNYVPDEVLEVYGLTQIRTLGTCWVAIDR